jgi:UDP-GlcNAc:undecaprenyl-phosphate/decaprenyl-phosphate GlcNAc-1-phosphate transferase
MIWSPEIFIVLSLLVSFFVVYFSIPSIVTVSNLRGLFDKPGNRKLHDKNIPNLGGIAIFAGIVLSMTLFLDSVNNREFLLLITGMTVLFFIGLKDDILVIAPKKKLIGELFAILILVIFGGVRFTSLHGFIGIYGLNEYASIALTTFVMIVIINAFNLIDGIDGLAAGTGILISITFGIWFYLIGQIDFAILSAAVIGAYIAFFGYNVFGSSNKIFMGDTGSLLLGFLVSLLVVRFNEIHIAYIGPYSFKSAPAVSFGILIVPMFDTIRVFVLRVYRGQSPFKADKNHVHHRLLKLGFSHVESTLIITSVNILFIVLMIVFNSIGLLPLMFINLSLALVFLAFTEFFIKKQKQKQKRPFSGYSPRYNHRQAKSA